MHRGFRVLLMVPFILAGVVVFTALGGFLVQWLWNWLLPPLFGWPAVTFWQALGLLVLCRILFGRMGPHRMSRGGVGRRIRRRVRARLDHLTPEERERFRQRMRDRFGDRSAPDVL